MIPMRWLARTRPVVLGVLFLAMVSTGVGCGLPKQWHDLANKMPEATSKDPAYQMLAVWEPADGVDQNGLPTRGFAGKITFFTRRQETGVRVRGDVQVSVFDDQGPVEKRGQPFHNWVFKGDAWAIHLQDSQLGPAYSVFIPYSRKGNHEAQCALQVQFTPEDGGPPLYSDTVAVVLPGKSGRKDNQPLNAGQTDKRTSLESITIPLHEKRKADLANLELGKTERNHVVAPVSELVPNHQTRSRDRSSMPSRNTLETRPGVMETLPTPPGGVAAHVLPPEPLTPEETAKPVSEYKSNFTPTSQFSQFPTPSSKPKYPAWESDSDETVGTNPSNR